MKVNCNARHPSVLMTGCIRPVEHSGYHSNGEVEWPNQQAAAPVVPVERPHLTTAEREWLRRWCNRAEERDAASSVLKLLEQTASAADRVSALTSKIAQLPRIEATHPSGAKFQFVSADALDAALLDPAERPQP